MEQSKYKSKEEWINDLNNASVQMLQVIASFVNRREVDELDDQAFQLASVLLDQIKTKCIADEESDLSYKIGVFDAYVQIGSQLMYEQKQLNRVRENVKEANAGADFKLFLSGFGDEVEMMFKDFVSNLKIRFDVATALIDRLELAGLVITYMKGSPVMSIALSDDGLRYATFIKSRAKEREFL